MQADPAANGNAPGDRPLRPAVTQWSIASPGPESGVPMPPFRPSQPRPDSIAEADAVRPTDTRVADFDALPSDSAAGVDPETLTDVFGTVDPSSTLDAAAENTAEPAAEWNGPEPDEEGVVEPAFEEDVNATEEMLAENSPDEFPADAFIIPEDSRRVPTGLAPEIVEQIKHHHDDAAHVIADRFEKLSRRLRSESLDTLLQSLARGDRFDALIAGFLAGVVSAKDG